MIKPVLETFLNKPISKKNTDYTLFSAPLDLTTSNRRGTRFGPNAVRRESNYLDTYSLQTGFDWKDINIIDIGDLECSNVEEAIINISKIFESVKGIPVMLGGEHTITLGALRALKPELVVIFDAHLDLRDELFGKRLCHATYLRRAYEELGFKIVIIGSRALSKEEVNFTKNNHHDIIFITSREIIDKESKAIEKVQRLILDVNSFYLSIDMDALDPSFAPAVGNPHPEGLSVTKMMKIITSIMNHKLIGMDLVEVYPSYDKGLTATTAAYILLETIYAHMHSSKTKKQIS
jgi:agmatinase